MTSRTFLAVLLTVIVLTAGCVGGGGGPVDDGDTPDATAAGAADGGDGGDGAATGGDGGDGSADTSGLALTDRERALRDAGSFTATWTYSGTSSDGETGEFGVTYAADLTSGRSLVVTDVAGEDDSSITVFRADGVVYTRFESGEDAFYTVADEEDETNVVDDALGYGGLYEANDRSDLTFVGTETFDGVAVRRYETSGAESFFWAEAAGTTGTSPDDLDSLEFDYVLLVDEDGLARHEAWSVFGTTNDGDDVEFHWQYELTDVGSTTVEDPAWLEDAMAQAPN